MNRADLYLAKCDVHVGNILKLITYFYLWIYLKFCILCSENMDLLHLGNVVMF